MALPSTQILASWVKLRILADEWTPLNETLQTATEAMWKGKSRDEISDFCDEKLPYVANHLRDEFADAARDGAVCPFEIDDEDPPYIRRCGPDIDHILSKLKKICPFEFENVCARLLTELGVESYVTAKTADGGIDFISVGVDILPVNITSPQQCRAAVIGQAKRYRDKSIAEKSLREFVGSSLVQRNTLRIQKKIAPLTPVLLAFWTTADFEPSCKEFARKAGVWLMDGHTLSTYLVNLQLSDWILGLVDVD